MDYWQKYTDMNKPEKYNSELYSTDEFTKEAMTFLEKRQEKGSAFESDNPFFMYMAYNAPHHPYSYPDSAELDEFQNLPTNRRDYMATLYRLDVMIGRLVDKLEQTGQMDNTYIVFQADNGPIEGGSAFPLRGKKSTFAEGGLRVPAFIVGPGIPADSELDRLDYIHLSDWLPTFLDLAGADVDDPKYSELDGKSYKGVFLDNEKIPRTEMFHNGHVTRGVSDRSAQIENIILTFRVGVISSFEKKMSNVPTNGKWNIKNDLKITKKIFYKSCGCKY